jgi:hypothetical protein
VVGQIACVRGPPSTPARQLRQAVRSYQCCRSGGRDDDLGHGRCCPGGARSRKALNVFARCRGNCAQGAVSPAIENFLVRRSPTHARRAGAPAAHAAPPDRRPSSAGSAAPEDGGNAAPVGLGSCGAPRAVLAGARQCELCARGATAKCVPTHPARWRESLAFLRLAAGPTLTDGAHLGCDARFAPGAARKPRNSAAYGGFSARRVRRVGSHPDQLTILEHLRLSSRQVQRVGANCEPGFTPCR